MTTSTYPGTVPTHSRSVGSYTFPALVRIDACKAMGVPFYGEDPTCTQGGKRRREVGTGRLIEGRACGEQAQWASVWVPHRGNKSAPLIYRPGVFLCSAHAREKARRSKTPMLETVAQYDDYRAQVIRYWEWSTEKTREENEQAFARMAREHAERERETLAREGRILRLSGMEGRMYALADGTPVCEMRDGSLMTPCCWADGARLIDNRVRGRRASGHSPGCPNATGEAL